MKLTSTDDDTVYVCNCLCHLPRGWRWESSQPRPQPRVFVPCEDCDNVMHGPWDERPGVEAYITRAEPEPVRSIPVPLTVRRHTEQSRAILFDNLRAALPADMLDEDRDHIATALLESTIAHGDTLRRKRLVDKLMVTAQEIQEMAQADLDPWADVMRDAAEEIRSML